MQNMSLFLLQSVIRDTLGTGLNPRVLDNTPKLMLSATTYLWKQVSETLVIQQQLPGIN